MIKETIVPMELIKELGRRIQKARKEKGLTQQELADRGHNFLGHVYKDIGFIHIGIQFPKIDFLHYVPPFRFTG